MKCKNIQTFCPHQSSTKTSILQRRNILSSHCSNWYSIESVKIDQIDSTKLHFMKLHKIQTVSGRIISNWAQIVKTKSKSSV